MLSRLSRGSKLFLAAGSAVAVASYCGYSGNERFYKHAVMPCVRLLDAEKAHVFAVKTAAIGLVPRGKIREGDQNLLKSNVFGIEFSNPVGLAAGFDKNAECFDSMLKVGFGFVEIGSVTPKPQEGNAKPRVFRLSEDKAVINRYGFNSHGLETVKMRLLSRSKDDRSRGILGINLGRNKTTKEPVADFVKGVEELGELADYIVINISSPNTPGLRKMQGKQQLQELISEVLDARNQLKRRPPLLVKVAPDLTEEDKIDIAVVLTDEETKVDGLIVTNTTITRPSTLTNENKTETGGLSGKPLTAMSTAVVGDMYKLTQGKIPIIGVGGISSGQDAYDKIRAGASLVQLYTVMTFEGPVVVNRIQRELAELLRRDGFECVSQAVGVDHT